MSDRKANALGFLYGTSTGRLFLKALTTRRLSKVAGAFCDSPISKFLIKRFIRVNGIDLSEYQKTSFTSFNDCFTREIKPERRPICMENAALISPCDGLLSAYKIESGTVFPAKQSTYSVSSLLQNQELAQEFDGGVLLVFRLCVNHYHRYCYVDAGAKGDNIFIPGKLHTVRPIALEHRAVFCENCREYTVMETENFGKTVQCEIGAMLVGRIQNHHGASNFQRGQEKGMFLYGGSTVVLILKKDVVAIPTLYFENTRNNTETPVKLGEKIGQKI